MKRKILASFLLIGMGLTVFSCKPQEDGGKDTESFVEDSKVQESIPGNSEQEDSHQTEIQIPEDWVGPEIFRFRLRGSEEFRQEEKVDQAIRQMGSLFLNSRIGTLEQAKEGYEPYGYWIEKYDECRVKKSYNTQSRDMAIDEELGNINIQKDGRTWIAGYIARMSYWGSLPKTGGPEPESSGAEYWNLGDWWVIHQEGEVFSMMSYTDYQRAQQVQMEDKENPFAAYPVQAETVPESEYRTYNDQYGYDEWFEKFYVWSDEVFYFEPLKSYLRNEAIIFEYEADTEEDTEEEAKKAALELGRMYLEELCSKDYDPYMTGKHMSVTSYYVREYKDLGLTLLAKSTEEDMMEKEQIQIEPADNIWIAGYSFFVKTDDPVWGEGEEFVDYRESGLSRRPRGIIVKQGKKYFMVMIEATVRESVIRFK